MHAFEDIAGLYREELRSLREDAVRFAVRNPGMARQLGLASDAQPDPLVNLLLESFAWLAARVRADAESRLPLVSHSLLGLLYPQFVCPIPSVGVAEFIPNPAGVAGLPDGFGIPAHTSIHNRDERGGVLRWRTARPLTLHPAKVVRASIIPPASWMPAAAQGVPGVLCLRIEGIAGLSLAKFGLPSLSLHLGGDRFATFPMHEWVHGACRDVFLADDAGAARPRALSLGREALCHAGLEPGGRLFPESAYALPGYQLLQEYFAYPEHLLFWEVGGLERRRELGDLSGFESPVPRGRAAAENGFLKIVPHLRRTCGQLVRATGGTHTGGSRALGTSARAGSAAPGQYGSPFRDRCGRSGGRETFFGHAVFFSFRRRGCAAVPDVVPAQEAIFGRHRDGRVSAFQGSGVPPGDGSAVGGFRAGIVHEPPPCRRALASGRTDAGYGHAHGGYPLLRPSFATARSAHVRRRTVEARFPSQPPPAFFERAGC